MLARPIVTQVAGELNDPTFVTWSEDDHISFINSARRQVILMRPDAYSVVESIQLTAGSSKHSLPAGRLRLLDVIRNMGSDGNTPGRAIRMIDRGSQDLYNRNWHKSDKAKTVIREVVYNDKYPRTFYTDPPAHATTNVYIEAAMSALPADIEDLDTDDILIPEIYEQPIRQYMLHLAFGVEVESRASMAKSRAFLQDFYNSLGIKTKVDQMFTPSKD